VDIQKSRSDKIRELQSTKNLYSLLKNMLAIFLTIERLSPFHPEGFGKNRKVLSFARMNLCVKM